MKWNGSYRILHRAAAQNRGTGEPRHLPGGAARLRDTLCRMIAAYFRVTLSHLSARSFGSLRWSNLRAHTGACAGATENLTLSRAHVRSDSPRSGDTPNRFGGSGWFGFGSLADCSLALWQGIRHATLEALRGEFVTISCAMRYVADPPVGTRMNTVSRSRHVKLCLQFCDMSIVIYGCVDNYRHVNESLQVERKIDATMARRATRELQSLNGIASMPEPLDTARRVLVNLFGQWFGRRLEIGDRDKRLLACSKRGLLRSRVAMSANTCRIIVFLLVIASALIVPAILPASLDARESTPAIVLESGVRVGGEPGEDPHLKVDPSIRPVMDSESLGASGAGMVGVGEEYTIQREGVWEGRGCSLGSRVNLAWRMILWAWLCQLQR
jgi:hypothetical protein